MQSKAVGFISFALVAFLVGCGSSDPATPSTPAAGPKPATTASTAKGDYAKVQAIFDGNCIACHGAGRPRGGIDLRNYQATMKGGEEGAIVKAGDPASSLLVKSVKHLEGAKPMPMGGAKLSDADIKVIESWVKKGAKNG